MSSISDLLRESDPVRHEPPVADEERNRIRRVVIGAPAEGERLGGMRRWRSRSVLVATAAILLGLAVMVMRPSSSGTATLEAAVRFEVRLAETEPANGLTEARIAPGRVIYLHPDPVVTNDDIADARVVQRSDAPELYDIALTLTGSGGEKMRKATAGHIGLPMAILIDGEVVMAPTVRSEISNQARITGRYSRADAERIANGMRLR